MISAEQTLSDFNQVQQQLIDMYIERLDFNITEFCSDYTIGTIIGKDKVLKDPRNTIYNPMWLSELPMKIYFELIDACIETSINHKTKGYINIDTFMEYMNELQLYRRNPNYTDELGGLVSPVI